MSDPATVNDRFATIHINLLSEREKACGTFCFCYQARTIKFPIFSVNFAASAGDTIRCVGKTASPITAVSAGETSVKAGGLCFARIHRFKNDRELPKNRRLPVVFTPALPEIRSGIHVAIWLRRKGDFLGGWPTCGLQSLLSLLRLQMGAY